MTQDTYPIIIKPPMFNLSKVIAIIFGIIILILWYKTCHPPKPVTSTLVPVISINDQKAVVVHDTVLSNKVSDSLIGIQKKWEVIAKTAEFDKGNAEAQTLQLQNDMNDLINTPLPDTCEVFRSAIKQLNIKLNQSTVTQTNLCNAAINAQRSLVSNRDAQINNGKKEILSLRRAIDTAFAQQSKLQANIKTLKPKSEVYAGIELIGNQTKPLTAYGINLGLKTKKGTYFEVGAFQMSSVIYYQASYKKTIFKL